MLTGWPLLWFSSWWILHWPWHFQMAYKSSVTWLRAQFGCLPFWFLILWCLKLKLFCLLTILMVDLLSLILLCCQQSHLDFLSYNTVNKKQNNLKNSNFFTWASIHASFSTSNSITISFHRRFCQTLRNIFIQTLFIRLVWFLPIGLFLHM